MKRYTYKWIILIGIAASAWIVSIYAAKANGLEDATIYGIDRTVCGLQVNQDWINNALATAAVENKWTFEKTVDMAAQSIIDVQSYIDSMPAAKAVEYCKTRTAR